MKNFNIKSNKLIDKALLDDFNTKVNEKESFEYKIILIILICINLLEISFFIIFKFHIFNLTQLNTETSFSITDKENTNKRKENQINEKLVQLYSSKKVFHHEYLQIIKSKEEYDRIVGWLNSNYFEMYLCYSNTNETRYSYEPFNYCKYNKVLFILLKTSNGHRFGGALFNFYYNYNEIYDNRAFLFNFDSNTVFKVNNPNKPFTFFKKEERLVFGDEDLVIDFKFKYQQGYANFPKEFGDIDINTINDLTGGNTNFTIVGIEIITLINYDDI